MALIVTRAAFSFTHLRNTCGAVLNYFIEIVNEELSEFQATILKTAPQIFQYKKYLRYVFAIVSLMYSSTTCSNTVSGIAPLTNTAS
jgi:hypothetical protein